ncbi:MAG: flagellin FliC3, partial [Lachnospiraceae bacterium]|jgi:flagellin|nr:flagellin FliC3 [Lachnospiraceae bacterium]
VDIKVAGYSDYVANGKYWLEDLYVEFNEAGNIILESVSFNSDPATFSPPYGDPGTNYVALPPDATVTAADGNVITITAAKGFELHLEIRRNDDNSTVIADPNGDRYAMEFVDPIYLDIVGFGAMDMQVGANEGQQLNIRIHRLSLENMGISNIDLSTYEGALDALGKMGKAVNYVSTARSHVGAYQNRLEHIISNLDISTENLTGAYSRIMDTDMATEMTNYTTYQILVQASTSMLAQANERPATVLQLLQ